MEDELIVSKFSDPHTQEEAFNALVKKYQERIYWHVRRMVINHEDADDVVQNTFVKVWRNLENFRSDSKLYTWMYRIATNECITFLNKKKKRNNVSLDHEDSAYLKESLASATYFDGEKAHRRLQEAILTLPDKQRLVFNMKYFEDLKYTDMSDILDTSVGALKASYHLAVKKIEKFFKEAD